MARVYVVLTQWYGGVSFISCKSESTRFFQVQWPCSGSLELVLWWLAVWDLANVADQSIWVWIFLGGWFGGCFCFLLLFLLFIGKADIKHLSAHCWCLSDIKQDFCSLVN